VNQLNNLIKEVESIKGQLTVHPLYSNLKSLDDLHIFMEEHIYAVWDFMSLLKALQNHVTCTTVPWRPNVAPKLARFINEIVLGEECDENEIGEIKSHFEMYVDAMQQIKADTSEINAFLESINNGASIDQAIKDHNVSPIAAKFLKFTFSVIETGKPHLIASAFTFGREDLIPDMFIGMVKQLSESSNVECNKLIYYLQRHIEIDGDEHGPLSLELVQNLCGEDETKWKEATEVAKEAMQTRIELWNGINTRIAG
jgi:hypothetical protein